MAAAKFEYRSLCPFNGHLQLIIHCPG